MGDCWVAEGNNEEASRVEYEQDIVVYMHENIKHSYFVCQLKIISIWRWR